MMEQGGVGPDGRLETERQLCDQLGVARRTVRKVLESLEAEGLIWRKQGKGTFLGQPPDPKGALAAEITRQTTPFEVMEARLWIEPALAALCAMRVEPEHVQRMRHLANRVSLARDRDSAELWDSALHRMIARIADNGPLMTSFALLDQVRATDGWQLLRAQAQQPHFADIIAAQHDAIINAIAARDTRGAEYAMRAHIQMLMDAMQRSLDQTRAAEVAVETVMEKEDLQ